MPNYPCLIYRVGGWKARGVPKVLHCSRSSSYIASPQPHIRSSESVHLMSKDNLSFVTIDTNEQWARKRLRVQPLHIGIVGQEAMTRACSRDANCADFGSDLNKCTL